MPLPSDTGQRWLGQTNCDSQAEAKGVQALCKGAYQSKYGIAVINSSESRWHCSAAHLKQDGGQSFCGRKPIPRQWAEGQEGFAAFERGLSRTGQ
jgi:hypothetical protein